MVIDVLDRALTTRELLELKSNSAIISFLDEHCHELSKRDNLNHKWSIISAKEMEISNYFIRVKLTDDLDNETRYDLVYDADKNVYWGR